MEQLLPYIPPFVRESDVENREDSMSNVVSASRLAIGHCGISPDRQSICSVDIGRSSSSSSSLISTVDGWGSGMRARGLEEVLKLELEARRSRRRL